jgi:hypothetical protein
MSKNIFTLLHFIKHANTFFKRCFLNVAFSVFAERWGMITINVRQDFVENETEVLWPP